MARKLMILASSALMVVGMAVVTMGFRDLPLDERPEWMAWQMILWPMVALGVMEVGRLRQWTRQGMRLRADRFRLVVHGLPALAIATVPGGTFTNWAGVQSLLALLDFPTAKVMAAIWLSYTLWASWEVGT
ncbi:MAG: hypothetical protein K6U14_00740 [Firmicutes bacterium]|nr:hypothetical protein [Alicyclobacillaceae bacterium]MCL6496145.1 hypothetical protein [Bacillota bacterium]